MLRKWEDIYHQASMPSSTEQRRARAAGAEREVEELMGPQHHSDWQLLESNNELTALNKKLVQVSNMRTFSSLHVTATTT